MARKTDESNRHEFTRQIHSTMRAGTRFSNMENHDEKEAKKNKKICCHDCRGYLNGCDIYIGKYHKTCDEFKWW